MWVLPKSATVSTFDPETKSSTSTKKRLKRTKLVEADGTRCKEQMCDPYHSVATVGSSTGTPADDFVYAFLVDGCITF